MTFSIFLGFPSSYSISNSALSCLLLLLLIACHANATIANEPAGQQRKLRESEIASSSSAEKSQSAAGGGQQPLTDAKRPSLSPSSPHSSVEGSGAPNNNPDDEDGDVGEEGSGDVIEGSGSPEEEGKKEDGSREQPKPGIEAPRPIDEGETFGRHPHAGSDHEDVNNLQQQQQPPTTSTTSATKPTFTSTTTTTTMRATTLATTTRKTPTTTTTTAPVIRLGTTPQQQPRPTRPGPAFGGLDPTGTLEQLKPGIFAIMIGAAVVLLLLIILVVTYFLYRIRKKDEGSYTCEEPSQPHHYSYAYQKASIKEFYA